MDPLENQNQTQNPDNIEKEVRESIKSELESLIDPGSFRLPERKVPIPNKHPLIEEIGLDETLQSAQLREERQRNLASPIIRTYKSDVEEKIQAGHISSVNIAMSQNDRMVSKLEDESTIKTKKNLNIILITLTFVLGGIIAIFIPYYMLRNELPQTKTEVKNTENVLAENLMTVDVEEKVNVKDINQEIVQSFFKQKLSEPKIRVGQIENLYITEGQEKEEKLISTQSFLSLIKAKPSDEISRTLKPKFLLGVQDFTGYQKFLILKVGSYDIAYSGMLSWEPNLWQDFKEIFDLEKSNNTDSFGIEVKKFEDATYSNKDARIVKNSAGKVAFLYSIIDSNTIVITTSVDTLKEIITRINRTRPIIQ